MDDDQIKRNVKTIFEEAGGQYMPPADAAEILLISVATNLLVALTGFVQTADAYLRDRQAR
jgi:hypothetical protein